MDAVPTNSLRMLAHVPAIGGAVLRLIHAILHHSLNEPMNLDGPVGGALDQRVAPRFAQRVGPFERLRGHQRQRLTQLAAAFREDLVGMAAGARKALARTRSPAAWFFSSSRTKFSKKVMVTEG